MILCLSLGFAGRTWRIATRPCDPVSLDGPIHFLGGLPSTATDEKLDLLSDATPPDYSTDVLFPCDVAALVEGGHSLDGSPIEVAWWDGSSAWEERAVYMRGTVRSSEYGAGTPTRIQAWQDQEDHSSYPPSDAEVTESGTWAPYPFGMLYPTLFPDSSEGRRYPSVFGHPGIYKKGGGPTDYRRIPGSPAPLVLLDPSASPPGFAWVLVAGHRIDRSSSATIRIIDGSTGVCDDVSALNVMDGPSGFGYLVGFDGHDHLGRYCSVYRIGIIGNIMSNPGWSESNPLYACWIGAGGQSYDGGTLERAGDVLSWALRQSGLPVDWERTTSAARQLGWRLDGFWDAACSPWEWARNNLIPYLPLSIRVGPAGLYPLVWRWWDPYPRAHLEDGRNVHVAHPIRWEGADQEIATSTLRYAVDASTGEARAFRTVGIEQPPGYGVSRSLVARSRQATGIWEQTCPLVWSDLTAGLVANTQLLARCRRRTFEVDADPRTDHLQLGDQVEVTVSRWSLTRALATVTGIRTGSARRRLTLAILPRLA